ncbi:MAG: hypothetical protein IPH88_09745 [Bacteroidales bacterium]|nr:hypothetical protein [Bacteroidales bacterium]
MKKLLLFLLALSLIGTGYGQKLQKYNPNSLQGGAEIGDEYYNPLSTINGTINNNTDVLQVWSLPSDGSTSGNTRAPGNSYKYQRTEYLVTAAEMAASGFPSGYTIDAIGFLIATAGATTQSGTFKVYLMNTTDATYNLGAAWTTTGFTLASNIASWTVPIAAGSYVVQFAGGTPFTYTGGGVYVAWEFSNAGTAGTTALVANCNTALTNGLYGQRSATALPTTLVASSFRPATIFVNNSINDIVSLTNIYTLERAPLPYGSPVPITVRASNVSATATTFDVTVTVKDATNTFTRFTSTQTVTALAGGSVAQVNFAWTPANNEDVNIYASTNAISGETWTTNNSTSMVGNVNNNLFSYTYNTAGPDGFGYTYPGTGLFASKFHMNGTGVVPGANLVISADAATTGNTIYAVLMNSAGTILTQSADYVIAAGDLGVTKSFSFLSAQSFTNEDFYVALAQTAGTAQYYPMGTFVENVQRDNTFYTGAITGGTLTALATSFGLKYGIEAQVQAPAATVNPSAFTATPASTTQINLSWALNPSGNNVLIAYSTDGVFGTPVDGTTYAASSTIPGGGTVLQYNNATSFNHTGLTPSTMYYYKAWSYSGSTYSLGTGTNAVTLCATAVAPFNETFASAVFPPLCWSLSSGSPAWIRSTASAYGSGTGSAEANFYSISAVTPFDLISFQMDASAMTNPTLSFDFAYAAYSEAELDGLEIFASSDNGATWSSLLVMTGGPSGTMNTGGTTTSGFVPTAAQWATQNLALPAGTNKVKFTATSQFGNNLYIDNVKVIEVLSHDVAVMSIDNGEVVSLGTVSPLATVKNLGANTETFNVTITSGSYSSTKTVTALATNASAQVVFDPWTNALGDYSFVATASLGSDQDLSNNSVTKALKVLDLNKQVYAYQNGTVDGPVKFNLSDPGSLNLLVDQTALNGVFGGTWANELWYGTVYNTVAPYDFVSIDPVTGARTTIGDMGVGMSGLSYNPANSIMYAVAYNSTTTQTSLYTINMSTGAATVVGSTAANVLLINLAIDNSGNCYAMDLISDVIGTVDLATGAFTVVGPTGLAANYAQDMEFDRETGDLFMAAYTSTGELRWVNKTTGSTLLVGQFQGGAEVTGFAIPYSSNKTLNVTALFEGLATDRGVGAPVAGTMFQAYDELGAHFASGIADQVTLELRSAAGALVYSVSALNVSTSGLMTATIPAAYNSSYFIVIRHRNSITTASAATVSFSGSTITYDFTSGVSQAFGDNQKLVGALAYIYSGDENQDGLVDSSDLNDCDNESTAFTAGYVVTDVNGDGLVDSSDLNIIDNNNAAFVASVLPF